MPLQIINGVGRAGVRVTTATPQVSYDTDAQAFITATAITDTTQQNAINDLVLDLKAAGVWTKMKALYPMVGGTATTHKFNLKDPRDLDAAYRLVFNGGWTHSSTGALPNGTTGYANTFLKPFSNLTSMNNHLSYYSRTNTTFGYDNGVADDYLTSGKSLIVTFNHTTNISKAFIQCLDANAVTGTETNTLGLIMGSRTSSISLKLYRNGALKGTNSTSTSISLPNENCFLGGLYYRDVGGVYSISYGNKQCAFASIGDGLTDLESNLFYQIVEKYQYALGRNVNANQTFYFNRNYSNETNAFIFNGAISDATQQSAINTLVNDLKAAGIWTKMKALYPMVGGTATSHKFNLANPVDTDAAYRLVFNGGWTHSSTGALPNGTTGYANTGLVPNGTLSLTSNHTSFYSRSNQAAGTIHEVGCSINSNELPMFVIALRYTGDMAYWQSPDYNVSRTSFSNTDSRGFYIGSRTANNVNKFFKNNTLQSTNTTTITQASLPTNNIVLSAYNFFAGVAGYSNKQCAFSSIGDGLTDAEATTFYNAVQAFQTTLGRQV